MKQSTRRDFLSTLGVTAAALGLAPKHTQAARRPNILLVITDDQGFGDLGSHGNPDIRTPVQDRIADEGARFDRFYVCAVCAPTRAGLLTGRYHSRTGVSGTSKGQERMGTQEFTIAEALKEHGYATGAFGKWHNGHYYPEHPNAQGFEQFTGFCMGHWNGYFDPILETNGEVFTDKGYIVDRLTDHAVEFIEARQREPFFCYLAYNVPHTPHLVPDSYFDKYKARGFDDYTASVYGMTECVDENLARLLGKLDALDLADDTIVIFMSDNGPARTSDYPRYNAGMRGSKGSVHEGGVRTPFFVRWPGRIAPGQTIEPMGAYIDVFPTLLEMEGLPVPEGVALDGVSLAPLLLGRGGAVAERKLYSLQSSGPDALLKSGAVRTGRWLAVKESGPWQLYDLPADPGEKKDLAGERPEITAELRDAFDAWFADVTKGGLETPPIPVGYPEWPEVDVLAQDARCYGSLDSVANNGYLVEWKDTDAYPEWTLDVAAAGLFEVSLLYTCAQENTGVKVRVTLGEKHLEGAITEAHDPPFNPSPQRVIYPHYYEKPFKPLRLGVLRLGKGINTLRVNLLDVPGKEAMHLRAVRLRRLG